MSDRTELYIQKTDPYGSQNRPICCAKQIYTFKQNRPMHWAKQIYTLGKTDL